MPLKKYMPLAWMAAIALTFFFSFGRPSWWYEGRTQFIEREEPRTGDDDSVYYYIAEHFWGLDNDTSFVKLHPGFAALLKGYPIRGIGLGSMVLPFQRTLGSGQWRKPFTRLVMAINVFGFVVLSIGLASFLGYPILLAPLFAFLLNKFSLIITYPTAWCTEAVTRGWVPLLIGCCFLSINVALKKPMKFLLYAFIVFLGLGLCLMKIQWILGLMSLAVLLALHQKTRATAIAVMGSVLLSFVVVRSINYFSFGKNKELFSGSGQYALNWSPEGPTILKLACERNAVAPNLKETVCAQTPDTFWGPFLDSPAPVEDKAALFTTFSEINSELARKNIPERLTRLVRNGGLIAKEQYFPTEYVTKKKVVRLSAFGLLSLLCWLFLSWARKLQVLGVAAFVLASVILPSMSVFVFREYRYFVPTRSFFYLVPILCVLGLLVEKKEFLLSKVWPYKKGME